MMKFHSDADQIGLKVDGGGISIAVNDRHYFIKLTPGDASYLAVDLLRLANAAHASKKEKEFTKET